MCTLVVKRRLTMVTSIRSANSRSVVSSGRHEKFVRRCEDSAMTRRFLRFLPENASEGPQGLTGKAGDLTPCYRTPRLYS